MTLTSSDAESLRLRRKLASGLSRLNLLLEQRKQSRPGGLIEFVRYFWPVLEPQTELVEGVALEAVCKHLEAVTFGEITRLLINVPPGFMKSLLTDVFWPAWEWSAMDLPHHRFLAFSYSASLTMRDNGRFRDLIISQPFQEMWGHKFKTRKIGEEKITNDKTGWKLASSVGGVATGERANRVLCDDPHSVKEAESETVRRETVRWFREAMSNRLNDIERDAIVVIMQRVHEADVSGAILDAEMDYVHLCVPMEYEPGRSLPTSIGWKDWRTEPGELAWPERFPPHIVKQMRRDLGPYAYAGQYQQSPTPRGGGIIRPAWWKTWDDAAAIANGVTPGTYPRFSYVVASLDTAYTKKEENDPSACTIWGVWTDVHGVRRFMLAAAWAERLELHELVERVAQTCREFRVSRILIEAKASGLSVAQELRRRYLTLRDRLGSNLHTKQHGDFSVQLINPNESGDKVARLHSVVNLFEAGLIYAPDKAWVEPVMRQCEQGPKAQHDDLCFVAGTLIATRNGNRPIQEINVGDDVLTPVGWRKVVASGFTGVRPVVHRCGLRGTPNHPVFVLDRGYVPLDTVTHDLPTMGLSLCDLIRTIRQKALISTASPTASWAGSGDTTCLSPEAMPDGVERRVFTLPFGSFIQAKAFHLCTRFITRTLTPLIAASIIWSAYRKACIAACLRTSTKMLCERILTALACLRLFGTDQMKAVHGTSGCRPQRWIRSETGHDASKAHETVYGAELNLNTSTEQECSALLGANARSPDSGLADTKLRTSTMRPVFNLTVEGSHCYYANGILVHNCDTVSQSLIYLRSIGLAELPDERDYDDTRLPFRQSNGIGDEFWASITG